jgi:hypothetical protein
VVPEATGALSVSRVRAFEARDILAARVELHLRSIDLLSTTTQPGSSA